MRASPLINKRDALINKRDIIGLTKEIPPDILKRFIKLLMSTTRTTKEFYSTTNEFYTETLMTMAMQINSGCVQSSACDQRMILSPSGAVGGPLWVMPGPLQDSLHALARWRSLRAQTVQTKCPVGGTGYPAGGPVATTIVVPTVPLRASSAIRPSSRPKGSLLRCAKQAKPFEIPKLRCARRQA
jgi:hypothetical protein